MAGKTMIDIMLNAARSQSPKSEDVDVVQGTVTGLNPLTIEIENKLVLTEEFLVVGSWMYALNVRATLPDGDTMTIPVYTGIQVDDIVYMLRVARGQKYFVLDKEGGL